MSYVRQPLGATRGGAVLTAVTVVLEDPYLDETIRLVKELHAIESKKPRVKAVPSGEPGIGLRHVVRPLRALVYARKHEWVVPVALGALVALPVLLGFGLGRASKRRK